MPTITVGPVRGSVASGLRDLARRLAQTEIEFKNLARDETDLRQRTVIAEVLDWLGHAMDDLDAAFLGDAEDEA